MTYICNKIKSGDCDKLSCSHARLHKLGAKTNHTSCLNANCGGWKTAQCICITEAEIYALRLLYGIRIQ